MKYLSKYKLFELSNFEPDFMKDVRDICLEIKHEYDLNYTISGYRNTGNTYHIIIHVYKSVNGWIERCDLGDVDSVLERVVDYFKQNDIFIKYKQHINTTSLYGNFDVKLV